MQEKEGNAGKVRSFDAQHRGNAINGQMHTRGENAL